MTTTDTVIRRDEIERYYVGGRDFIDDERIEGLLSDTGEPARARVREIIAHARTIETLLPEETAALLKVEDPAVWEEIF
ncbi:MAG TPA: [FeFe] hydrogenase H-cluster radical SAM maturase HydG, partial [Spirochaetia bacterium]